jgi:hypothetical protein
MISVDSQGRISVEDLEKALAVIKHRPDEEVGHLVIEKLDVDKDGFVELDHLLELVKEEGLGQCSLRSRDFGLIFSQALLLMTKPRICLDKGRRSRT